MSQFRKGASVPVQPRPILAVRLIGQADVVAAQKTAIVAQLMSCYGDRAICRSSTHHARYTGEIRVYVTVTRKE